MRVPVGLSLNQEILDRIDQDRLRKNLCRSAFIRLAVLEFLEKREKEEKKNEKSEN